MLEYVSLRDYKHLKHLNRLWNGEFHSTYPLKKALYKSKILEDRNLNKDASFIALYDNEPVGFIFIKTWATDSGLNNESDTAYISLIFVKKEMRNMGIGSDMLQLSVSELRKYSNLKKLAVGNEMKHIFSGIPSNLTSAPIFFMNKGFIQKDSVVDMIRVVRNEGVEEIDCKDLHITIATEEEKDAILKLCVKNNWKREAYLVNEYYENGGSGRRIAVAFKDNKIIGLVRFNDENKLPFKKGLFIKDKKLGSIHYVKIDEEHINEEYEIILNKAAKNYLLKRGCKKVIVASTKKINFYKKLGYSAYNYYLQFELEL